MNFYTDYEKEHPKTLQERIRAEEEENTLEIWENRWLSPDKQYDYHISSEIEDKEGEGNELSRKK